MDMFIEPIDHVDHLAVAVCNALLADNYDQGREDIFHALGDREARLIAEGQVRFHIPCPPIGPDMCEQFEAYAEGVEIGREHGKRWSYNAIKSRCPWPHPLMKSAFELGFFAGHAETWGPRK
jgi:hypothetical protein